MEQINAFLACSWNPSLLYSISYLELMELSTKMFEETKLKFLLQERSENLQFMLF